MRVLRNIYKYLTIEQKKEAIEKLRTDKLELQREVNRQIDGYPKIVREVLLHTLDNWNFELEELENEIKNGLDH
jgi:hypothetical protein